MHFAGRPPVMIAELLICGAALGAGRKVKGDQKP